MLRYGGHIAVENLQDALPRAGAIAMRAIVAALLFAFFGFMVWYGWLYMERTQFQLTAATQIPFAYIYSAMPVGGVLLIVHWLLIVRRLRAAARVRGRRALRRERERVAMSGQPIAPHPLGLRVSRDRRAGGVRAGLATARR